MFVIVGAAGLVVMAIWWYMYRDPNKLELVEINKDEEQEVKTEVTEKQIG
jgi:hypothetical protein